MESTLKRRLPHLLRQFPKVSRDGIEAAAAVDPAPGLGNLTWIVRMISQGIIRLPEDGGKVGNRLAEFGRLKRLPAFTGPRDIGAYRSYGDLARAVEAAASVRSGREEMLYRQQAGCKLVLEAGGCQVYEISTPEAATMMAKGTEWCTKDPEYSEDYLRKGPLYVVIEKGEKRAQIHAQTQQWKDVWDDDLSADDYWELRELLIPVLGDEHLTTYRAAFLHVNRLAELYDKGGPDVDDPAGAKVSEVFDLTPFEKVMATDAGTAADYAVNILRGRFVLAEPVIAGCAESAAQYARSVLRGRWPEAEPVTARHGQAALSYAYHVLHAPWPEAERQALSRPAGADHNGHYNEYVKRILMNRRFDLADILRSQGRAYQYAEDLRDARGIVDRYDKQARVGGPSMNGQQALQYNSARYFLDWAKNHGPTIREVEDCFVKDPGLALSHAQTEAGQVWPDLNELAKTDPAATGREAMERLRAWRRDQAAVADEPASGVTMDAYVPSLEPVGAGISLSL